MISVVHVRTRRCLFALVAAWVVCRPGAPLSAAPALEESAAGAASSNVTPPVEVPSVSARAAELAAQPAEPGTADWIRRVYARSVGSVLLIEAGERTGSGFCMFAPDLVVTALHVVDDAPSIRVESTRGHRRSARIVTYSETYDLALLRLERPFEGMALLQAEREVSVGDQVAVIGHPLAQLARSERRLRGLLAWSVSDGVVGAATGSWLQTNAALNPGTSGGPTLNREGRVIGVVSARVRDAQNIGMISRIQHAEELLGELDRGAPPRRLVKFDGVELGVVIHWGEDTLSGITAGAGARVLDDILLRVRAGLLDGTAEPQAATVLTSHVTRLSFEAVAGYAFALPAHVSLAAEAGVAVARDRREDASLLAGSDATCAAPPCLVAGDVLRSSSVDYPLWPELGATAAWGPLRLGYAFQIDSPVQHRVSATFAF